MPNLKPIGGTIESQDLNDNFSVLDEQLAQTEILNLKSFGIVGDGLTDETEKVREAFSSANGKKIIVPSVFDVVITGQITMPSDIVIDCKGKFTCNGDEDFWFFNENAERVIFENINAVVTKPFAERTKLNRVIRCEIPKYMEVKVAHIEGASTAIHNLNGEDFICGGIKLKNVYGTAAQYGYGVNSSAKRNIIKTLIVENDSADDGRHALYINGGQWELATIGNLYVKNWNKNPVNFTHTNADGEGYGNIETATFINSNKVPTFNSTGCVHLTGAGSPKVKIHVGTLMVKGISAPAFSVMEGYSGCSIDNLFAEDLDVANIANSALTYFRGGKGHKVGKLHCDELKAGWISALYFRDCVNAMFDDVFVGGSLGNSVRILDSSLISGNITGKTSERLSVNGSSTVRPKGRTTGTRTASTSGSLNYANIAHGLGVVPSHWMVQKAITGLPAIDYVIADATNLVVYFVSNIPQGTNNIVLKWEAQV